MPIYEFTCEQCGHEFSVLVRRMGDLAACPECHSERQRRMSGFAPMEGRPVRAAMPHVSWLLLRLSS